MNIVLTTDIKVSHGYDKPTRYFSGEILEVIPASNQPEGSKIHFWIQQDGWEDDAYGFPVYVGEYKILENVKYEILTLFTYGWENVSTDGDDNPLIFDTLLEAKAELEDYMNSLSWAQKEGDIFDFEPSDYKVGYIQQ